MGHYIACVKVVELKDVVYHLFLRVLNNAFFATDIDHHTDLLLGDVFFVSVGVKSEQTDYAVGRHGEHLDKWLGYLRNEQQDTYHLERHFFGHLHRDPLGGKLAQNEREIRGDDGDKHDGNAVYDALGYDVDYRGVFKCIHEQVGEIL